MVLPTLKISRRTLRKLLVVSLLAILGVSLLVAVTAYRVEEETEVRKVKYELIHDYRYAVRAVLKPTILYGNVTELSVEEGRLFYNIIKWFEISLNYRLVPKVGEVTDAGGRYRVVLRINSSNGWIKELTLINWTDFSGRGLKEAVKLNLTEVLGLAVAIEEELRLKPREYELALITEIKEELRVADISGEESVKEDLKLPLIMSLIPRDGVVKLESTKGTLSSADYLVERKENYLNVLGFYTSVRDARRFSVAALLASAVGLIAAISLVKVEKVLSHQEIVRKFRESMIEGEIMLHKKLVKVKVGDIKELFTLAER